MSPPSIGPLPKTVTNHVPGEARASHCVNRPVYRRFRLKPALDTVPFLDTYFFENPRNESPCRVSYPQRETQHMNRIYLLRMNLVLSFLAVLAVAVGCSGEKEAETQSAVIDVPMPTTTSDPATPTQVVQEETETNTLDTFRQQVRACANQFLDDDSFISMLYSHFYNGLNAGYGSWYNQNLDYNDLLGYGFGFRGADQVKQDICNNRLKSSL